MRSLVQNKIRHAAPFETATESATGRYIYAIMNATQAIPEGLKGIDMLAVEMVADGEVAAVVSACVRQRIRPERAHLAAHSEVLKRLMVDGTILPMSFGTVADGESVLKSMLRRNRKEFVRGLERVRGKVEMGLRVIWDVPNIFEYFVDTHDELREARDRLVGGNRASRQEDKIELGQLFDRMLGDERDVQFRRLEEALSDCCFEIRRSTVRDVKDVACLNCLVGRDRQKDFEDAVFRAANLFDNNYSFDMNGPWAPHNFADVNPELNIR
jgi:hypothetical protein